MSRRAAAAGLTAEASSTSVPVVSMIRRTTSSSGSPDVRAQHPELAGEQREALPRLGGVGARRPGSASASSSDGISAGSMPSAISSRWSVIGRGVVPAPGRPASSMGAPAQQPEVARADRPARAGQQGQQRGVGGDVVEQAEDRHDLGDLGQPQQSGQADDLDGDAGPGQGVEDVLGVRVVAGEDADLRPGLVVGVLDRVDEPRELVGVSVEDRAS